MLKFVILTISIGMACGIKNLCDTNICDGFGYKHITCEIFDKFGPQCSDDAKVLEIPDDIKQKIIDDHNKYRNKIAGGSEPGFNSAAKMGTMVTPSVHTFSSSIKLFLSLRNGTKLLLTTHV